MSARIPTQIPDPPLEEPCGQLAGTLSTWIVGFCLIERTEFVSLDDLLGAGPTHDANALSHALRELARVGHVKLTRTRDGDNAVELSPTLLRQAAEASIAWPGGWRVLVSQNRGRK